jgi:hypothetical protein
MLTYFLLTLISLQQVSTPANWQLKTSDNRCEIYYRYQECTSDFQAEYISFKYSNKTSQKIKIKAGITVYYNQQCINTDVPFPIEIILNSGESKEGSCSNITDRNLNILSKMTGTSAVAGSEQFSGFQIVNLQTEVLP